MTTRQGRSPLIKSPLVLLLLLALSALPFNCVPAAEPGDTFGKGQYKLDPDCNRNGVADSEDLGAGVLQDLDGNGVADECEIAASAKGKSGSHQGPVPPIAIAIAYDAKHARVLIRYSVPSGSHEVRIHATSSADTTQQIVLESKRRSKGHYEVKWVPSDNDGHPLASGRWQVALSVDGVTIAKPVMWDWHKVML